jgi:hypothetical protein
MDTTAEKIALVIAVAPAAQISFWTVVVDMVCSFRWLAPLRMRGDWDGLSASRALPVLKEHEARLKRSGLVLNQHLRPRLRRQGYLRGTVVLCACPARAAGRSSPVRSADDVEPSAPRRFSTCGLAPRGPDGVAEGASPSPCRRRSGTPKRNGLQAGELPCARFLPSPKPQVKCHDPVHRCSLQKGLHLMRLPRVRSSLAPCTSRHRMHADIGANAKTLACAVIRL